MGGGGTHYPAINQHRDQSNRQFIEDLKNILSPNSVLNISQILNPREAACHFNMPQRPNGCLSPIMLFQMPKHELGVRVAVLAFDKAWEGDKGTSTH